MKKLILIAAILLTAHAIMLAQANPDKTVASNAKMQKKEHRQAVKAEEKNRVAMKTRQQFALDFPGATNVAYSRGQDFDEAIFTLNGKQLKAYYDNDFELIGTTQTKQFSDIPKVAQRYIQSHYKDYSINKVILFDDNEMNETDMILYGNSFPDEDNYFIELANASQKIILKSDELGNVSFFKDMSKVTAR